MTKRLLIGLFMVVAPAVGGAQQGGAVPAAAVQAATAFLRAAEHGDWRAAAALLDSASVDRMRRDVIEQEGRMDSLRASGAMTPHLDPDMPPAVAEYLAKRASESPPENWIAHQFADVPSADSLRALPLAVVAARFLEAQDDRHLIREQLGILRQQGCVPAGVPDDSALERFAPRYHVLGAFSSPKRRAKEQRTVWVAYDQDYPGSAPPDSVVAESYDAEPKLLALRSTPRGWRVLPEPMMLGASAMAMTGCNQGPEGK